jgi:hypothetical protein
MDSSNSSLDSEDSFSDSLDIEDNTPRNNATKLPSSVVELEIRNLEAELKENPNGATAWQKQTQLVGLLRQTGNIEAARTVRTTMAATYPLAEKLWLAWIDDEQRKTETDEEQVQEAR